MRKKREYDLAVMVHDCSNNFPNCPIERDPYYLTDDIDNYIVKEYATNDVVAIIKRSKLRDWEAFRAASDVVNYLNLSQLPLG